jgi:hypothetical protein
MTYPCLQRRRRAPSFVLALLGFVSVVASFVVVLLATRTASAYPWMIRHEYTGCSQCHVDPSGAGLMTLYGRAQSEVLLRTRYSGGEGDVDPELGGFVFGLVPLPEKGVRAQIDGRALLLHVAPPAPAPPVDRLILMQADAQLGLETDAVRASLSVGYAHEGALAASVTHGTYDRIVSRQHWAGYAFGDDKQFLVRAGRMNLPFGVRTLEHTLWVRSATRTDVNAAQQHGASLSYTGEKVRGEVMAIAGNFQLSPGELRERGYSAYAEVAASPGLAVGASSLVLHTERDPAERVSTFRQAHGVFARASPWKPLVVLAEVDMLVSSPKRRPIQTGGAAMLQLDVEVVQGVHGIATGELMDRTLSRTPLSYGGWLSAQWFVLPHVDVRVDGIVQSLGDGVNRFEVFSLLGQIHAFL